MNTVHYDIRLVGLDAPEGAIDMVALAELCRAFVDGAARALRLRVEGVSARSGPAPDWVREATAFRVEGLHPGSTILAIDAPVLSETPLFGGDGAPSDGFRPEETALSTLALAVQDLTAGDADSERVDRGLLAGLERFRHITGEAVRIEVSSPSRQSDRFEITPALVAEVSRLKQHTPRDRAVVMTGRLDAIVHGEARFTLVTDDGRRIAGSLSGDAATEHLRELWGSRVTTQGTARYNPAGHVRFVEADALRPFAEGDDELASLTMPSQLFQEHDRPGLSGPALADLRGTWPGDEPLEVLLAALRGDEPGAG